MQPLFEKTCPLLFQRVPYVEFLSIKISIKINFALFDFDIQLVHLPEVHILGG